MQKKKRKKKALSLNSVSTVLLSTGLPSAGPWQPGGRCSESGLPCWLHRQPINTECGAWGWRRAAHHNTAHHASDGEARFYFRPIIILYPHQPTAMLLECLSFQQWQDLAAFFSLIFIWYPHQPTMKLLTISAMVRLGGFFLFNTLFNFSTRLPWHVLAVSSMVRLGGFFFLSDLLFLFPTSLPWFVLTIAVMVRLESFFLVLIWSFISQPRYPTSLPWMAGAHHFSDGEAWLLFFIYFLSIWSFI